MQKIVLLIDDDIDDRELFCEALLEVAPDVTCHTSKSGLDALTTLKADVGMVPDYIFLDLNMPIMNGRQCLRELKRIKKLESTHFIIYSTARTPDAHLDQEDINTVHFLTKPTKFTELKEILANIMQEHWELVRWDI